ncbi:MAG: surface antigen [Myxococcales bacterium]|nr:surface antigen [Myxococcales bacterium]
MRISAVVCVLVAALVGCGPPPRVHKPGDEWLSAIQIEGSRAFDRDDLVPGLQLNRTLVGGRAVDPYQLSVDTERIRAAYLRRGYFDVTVKPRVETKPVNGTTAQTVIFKVVEGRRSTTQVEIRGLPAEVSPATARGLIGLRDKGPFEYEAFDAAKQPMITLVQNAGYPNAVIDAAVLADRAQGVATVRFEITPGDRATFGPISIGGAEGELADAIIGRLAFREGDPYSANAIAGSQRAIYEMARFSTVRIDPDRSAGTVVPVKISVTLGTLREVRGGFGAGYDPVSLEFRLRGGISVVPRHAPLWTLAADLRPAVTHVHGESFRDLQPKIRALATATRIDLFRPRVQGQLELSADYLTLEAYKTIGPRFRAGLSSPLGLPWLTGRVGWLLEYLVFDDVLVVPTEAAALNLDEAQRRGAFELSLDAELRDNAQSPHKGAFASLRLTQGGPYAAGAMTYTQLTSEVRGYVPLSAAVVLAGRLRVGLLFGDIPVTERYYSGGASNHRGFADRRLSPTVAAIFDDKPTQRVVGGTGLIETGIELRIPLGEVYDAPYGTTVFLDGGDVVRRRQDLDPAHLHWATGAGLFLQLGGLKVRFDIGYRLNRTGAGEPSPGMGFREKLEWFISVGETY